MARHLISVSGLGSPTAADFVASMNAALNGLLNKVLVSIQIVMTDALPAYTRQIQAIVEYEDGGVAQGAPFTVAVIESSSSAALKAQGEAYLAANASSFISPVQFRYSDQLPNVATRYLSFYFACTDAGNGAANYQVNGTTGGGGGTGTVTSVAILTQDGVSGSVQDPTTTPVITIVLGDILPNSVTAAGNLLGANLSGTNTGDQTITLTGDVLGSGTGPITTTIDFNVVSFDKIQQVVTGSLLGRYQPGFGDVELILVGSGLAISSGYLVALPAGTTLTGDVTGTGTGTVATSITNNAVTLAKIQQIATGSLLGRATAGTGNVEVITIGSGLTLTGTTLSASGGGGPTTLTGDVTGSGTGTFATTIANNAVTLAKFQQLSSGLLIGRASSGTGNIQTISIGTGLTLSTGGILSYSGNTGTVTSVSVSSSTGITSSVFNPSTTPNLVLNLGAITPTQINTSGNIVAGGNVFGLNLSGVNTGDQFILLTGDVTGGGAGTFAATIGANKVTFAKMQQIPTATLMGRTTAGTGNVESITIGSGLTLAGGVLNTSAPDLTNAVILFPATSPRNNIRPTADAIVGLSVQAFSGTHTANLQNWQTSTGVVRAYVSAACRISCNASGIATNEFFGEGAGNSAATGNHNTALGGSALAGLTSGTDNTALGNLALTAITNGSRNTALGSNALSNPTFLSDSTAVGADALKSITSGISNTAVGSSALTALTSNDSNTAVGYLAGVALTLGGSNTLLGRSAGANLTTGLNNSVLGANASASSTSVSNEITLGNSAINNLRCAVTTITAISDARDKTEIVELDAGLDFIAALRPVRFGWAMRDGGKVGAQDIGFIAQDLQSAQKSVGVFIPHLVMDSNPERLEAGYGMLLAPMVKAIQELRAKVLELEARA